MAHLRGLGSRSAAFLPGRVWSQDVEEFFFPFNVELMKHTEFAKFKVFLILEVSNNVNHVMTGCGSSPQATPQGCLSQSCGREILLGKRRGRWVKPGHLSWLGARRESLEASEQKPEGEGIVHPVSNFMGCGSHAGKAPT